MLLAKFGELSREKEHPSYVGAAWQPRRHPPDHVHYGVASSDAERHVTAVATGMTIDYVEQRSVCVSLSALRTAVTSTGARSRVLIRGALAGESSYDRSLFGLCHWVTPDCSSLGHMLRCP